MNVVLYKAKLSSGYLYDMSLNPSVDFEVLKNTRKINEIEIITPMIPLVEAVEILGRIYDKSILKKFVDQDYHLKRYNRKSKNTHNKLLCKGIELPTTEEIATVESCITGKVLTLRRMLEISNEININSQSVIDIIQILYCERRIKIVPSVRKIKGKQVCSFCEKSACDECCMDFKADDVLLYAADNYNVSLPRSVNYKKKKLNDTLSRAFDNVNSFMESNRRNLATIWCVPGSFDFSVLLDAIAKVLGLGGKVLYVTSSLALAETEMELSVLLDDIQISVVDRHTVKYKDIDVTLCSYNDYPCFHKSFDLVILDERMIFIDKTLRNILSISKRAVKENGKLIHITHVYDTKSNDKKSTIGELISIPVNNARAPIPEPLIVISRLLNESIPEMVIDTINWSMKENQKMIIFTPDEQIMHNFYSKLINLMDISADAIEFSTAKDKSAIIKLRKKELQVIISNDFKDALCVIDDLNVIVMNADHEIYSKDILMNAAAMAVYHTKKKCGHVIFVVEKDSESVNKTKESIRGINKIAWESGSIKK